MPFMLEKCAAWCSKKWCKGRLAVSRTQEKEENGRKQVFLATAKCMSSSGAEVKPICQVRFV